MLEIIRRRLIDYRPPNNPNVKKRASVLIPLIEFEGKLFVIFTKRSKNLRTHAGQISFPGGKSDSQDLNSLETALRETHEEIGLIPEKVEILGRLDQILSLHNYLVTPFVGLVPSDFQPIPNPEEIETVFKVPLLFFMKSFIYFRK